jgi:exodeoxyribonuclease VII small subunit
VAGDQEPSFEELMTELEGLTARMATGDIGIEEAAELYEQARALHGQATARLARVQARIDALSGDPRGDQPGAAP